MTAYRRDRTPGATWFFTLTLADRRSRLLVEHIDLLRNAFRYVMARHPWKVEAIVVLPDHLHALCTLPDGDCDYSTRWQLIKAQFSRSLPSTEFISSSRARKGERGVWQRRFWEHRIDNAIDLQRHVDYIHFNPCKHGHVTRVSDWPWSSFHRYVRAVCCRRIGRAAMLCRCGALIDGFRCAQRLPAEPRQTSCGPHQRQHGFRSAQHHPTEPRQTSCGAHQRPHGFRFAQRHPTGVAVTVRRMG